MNLPALLFFSTVGIRVWEDQFSLAGSNVG